MFRAAAEQGTKAERNGEQPPVFLPCSSSGRQMEILSVGYAERSEAVAANMWTLGLSDIFANVLSL